MPGPKMGPRPPDFDEEVIKQSPTFLKWMELKQGERLRYACREFLKGHGDDEERLMRRIMIARRNNIRDHETLKAARRQRDRVPLAGATTATAASGAETSSGGGGSGKSNTSRRRRPASTFSDQQVEKEMDVPAVEATRSYRQWIDLPEGHEFTYNQKYIKGKDGHDWLLRKNIWRRMRYRRENKKLVERMNTDTDTGGGGGATTSITSKPEQKRQMIAAAHDDDDVAAAAAAAASQEASNTQAVASHIVDEALLNDAAAAAAAASSATAGRANAVDSTTDAADLDQAAVEAAVAAAESFGKSSSLEATSGGGTSALHSDPLEAAAAQAALDAAAKLAAAAVAGQMGAEHSDGDVSNDLFASGETADV